MQQRLRRTSRTEGNNDINVLFNADGGSRPTCLQAAVRKNRSSCVKLLVGAGPIVGDVDYRNDCHDNAALHIACKGGFASIVRFLATVPGIDINARSRHSGFSPFLLAAKGGLVEVVKILLGLKGLNLGRDGERALKLANKGRHQTVSAILAEAMKKQRALDAAGMEVFEAAKDGDMAALQRLTEKWSGNADILNWVQPYDEDGPIGNNFDGMTPILAAVFLGRTEAVQMLLSTPGVDPHVVSGGFNGENICICAALSGSISCVRLMLSVPSANVNHSNSFGDSPLMVACRRGGNIDIVRELVRVSGVEINHTGWYRGESALVVAVRNRNTETVRILMEASLLDVNHKGTHPINKGLTGTHSINKGFTGTHSINEGLTAMDLLDSPDLGDLDE